MVSKGETHFSGIARDSETAGFIIDCLRSETTEDKIVAKMRKDWDVSDDPARRGVRKIVNRLKNFDAIDE